MKIYLDDIRHPETPYGNYDLSWVLVQSPFTFYELVPLVWDKLSVISFDNDLQCFEGPRDYTGYDCLTWLETQLGLGEFVGPIPRLIIHTSNASVRQKMQEVANALMDKYGVRLTP